MTEPKEQMLDAYLPSQGGVGRVPASSRQQVIDAGGKIISAAEAQLFRELGKGEVVGYVEGQRGTVPVGDLEHNLQAGFTPASFEDALSFLQDRDSRAVNATLETFIKKPTTHADAGLVDTAPTAQGQPSVLDLDSNIGERKAAAAKQERRRKAAVEREYFEEYVASGGDSAPVLPPEVMTAVQGTTRYLGGDLLREAGDRFIDEPFGVDLFQSRDLVRKNLQYNPNAAAAGEMVSIAAPSILKAGPAAAPVLIDAGSQVVGKAVATKTGSAIAGKVAQLGTEGAAYGVLSELDRAFLADDYSDITMKSLAGAAAMGGTANVLGAAAIKGTARAMSSIATGKPLFAKRVAVMPGETTGQALARAQEASKRAAVDASAVEVVDPTAYVPGAAASLEDQLVGAPPPVTDPITGDRLFGTFTADEIASLRASADAKQTKAAIEKMARGSETLDPDAMTAFRGDIFRRTYKALRNIARLADEVDASAGIRAKRAYAKANYQGYLEGAELPMAPEFPDLPVPEPEAALLPTSPMTGFSSGTGATRKLLRDAGLHAEWIDDMLNKKASSGDGGEAALGRLQTKIDATLEDVFAETDEPSYALVQTALDQIKRDTGKIAERVRNPFVKEALRARYQNLRALLESTQNFPEQMVNEQAQVNQRWARHISTGNQDLLRRFWIKGAEGAVDDFDKLDIPSPDVVSDMVRSVGKAEKEPLEAAVFDYLDAMRDDYLTRAKTWSTPEIVEKAAQLDREIAAVNYNFAVAKFVNKLEAGAKPSDVRPGLMLAVGKNAADLLLTAYAGPAYAGVKAAKGAMDLAKAPKARKGVAPQSLIPTHEQYLEAQKRVDTAAQSFSIAGAFKKALEGRSERSVIDRAEDAVVRIQTLEQLQERVDDLFSNDPSASPQKHLDDAAMADPAMLDTTAALIQTQREYIASKAATLNPKLPLQRRKLVESISSTLDPLDALGRISKGTSTPETLDALQTVWPPLLDEYRGKVIERISREELSYTQRLALSRRLGVPLDPSIEPARMAQLQALASSGAQGGAQEQALTPGNRREPRKLAELVRT